MQTLPLPLWVERLFLIHHRLKKDDFSEECKRKKSYDENIEDREVLTSNCKENQRTRNNNSNKIKLENKIMLAQ